MVTSTSASNSPLIHPPSPRNETKKGDLQSPASAIAASNRPGEPQLTEKTSAFATTRIFTSCGKMVKNLFKALEENQKVNPSSRNPRAIIEMQSRLPFFEKLTFSIDISSHKGTRPSMEDRSLCLATDFGILAAVFDGHGGPDVADYAKEIFEESFFNTLKKNQYDVKKTFGEIFDAIQMEVEKVADWSQKGSTAVICYVDTDTNTAFTATLGDSTADIFRTDETNGELYSIPLSNLRNWTYPKEAQRAGKALGEDTSHWVREENGKMLRFPSWAGGINVSRALGDREFKHWKRDEAEQNVSPAVSHKPKISMFTGLQQNDRLIIRSDGIDDVISRRQMETFFRENPANQSPAKELINYTIRNQRHSALDNMAVIVINCNKKAPP